MIVCHCAGVTDRTITELVREGVTTLKEVVTRTGAGRCCRPCRSEIQAIMAATEPAPLVD
jgi:bacterioferritin-associated ferredoxin